MCECGFIFLPAENNAGEGFGKFEVFWMLIQLQFSNGGRSQSERDRQFLQQSSFKNKTKQHRKKCCCCCWLSLSVALFSLHRLAMEIKSDVDVLRCKGRRWGRRWGRKRGEGCIKAPSASTLTRSDWNRMERWTRWRR